MNEPVIPIQSVESNLPIDYRDRFAALALKQDFADTVFAHVANGGTLITLATTWGVRHSDIANYIGSNADLANRYSIALLARNEWEVERCLQELRAIATVDIRDAYNPDGTLKNVRDLPPELAAALASVETDELFEGTGDERTMIGYTKKVKFWDKAKAIELFMKKHGLLIDRVKVQHTIRLEDLIGPANADIVNAEIVAGPAVSESIPPAGGIPGVLKPENSSA